MCAGPALVGKMWPTFDAVDTHGVRGLACDDVPHIALLQLLPTKPKHPMLAVICCTYAG